MVTKDGVYVLDMAAKIDATADYLCKAKWGDVEFPPPFGREAYPEVLIFVTCILLDRTVDIQWQINMNLYELIYKPNKEQEGIACLYHFVFVDSSVGSLYFSYSAAFAYFHFFWWIWFNN